MTLDVIFLAALLVAYFFSKRPEAFIAFGLTCIYAYAPIFWTAEGFVSLFDVQSAVMNHVVYGLIFIPFAFCARLGTAIVITIYSTFHGFVALDYLLYPDVKTFISSSYHFIQNCLALCLVLSTIKRGYDGTFSRHRGNPLSVLEHRECFVSHKETMEGKQ